ncbi:peptide chain release factor N(5)-glutamine methyltransferase [Nitrosomonas eutropha]|uniref:peptide chain release factor N(5)-glutamine methyltransferase n=1 Tax=Nitrosomonas eutropha TaxID=916 RepID=UPI0008BA8CB5|nr:peptide chain release factor N(5)-glutamine methyltransferase [Nitrosomonas eutropha]SEI45445.1 [protein release factor]-glutamine N5-methyltransferase [Nitrosomonas eutropha]
MIGNTLSSEQQQGINTPATIGELLQNAASVVDRVDARWLLQSVLNVDAAFLITHAELLLGTEQIVHFQQLLARRMAGEPVAYLTGERGFYDLVFDVTPDVLIPRPETELLVEMALSKIPSDRCCNILDLGTGSGAIAITIARHRPDVYVTAVDLSPLALAVARRNAKRYSVENVVFIEADWFSGFISEKFDVIVANPPYIVEGDPHLEADGLRFEPSIALVAQNNGLDCIRRIIAQAPDYLEHSGWLMLEHGYDQADVCRSLLDKTGFFHIFTRSDLAGIDRVTGGQYGLVPA